MNIRAIGAIALGVLAIGFGAYMAFFPSADVMCGSDVMQQGDLCETTRRGVTSTYTYDEMKENASSTPWIAMGVGVLILAYGIFSVVRGRKKEAPVVAPAA